MKVFPGGLTLPRNLEQAGQRQLLTAGRGTSTRHAGMGTATMCRRAGAAQDAAATHCTLPVQCSSWPHTHLLAWHSYAMRAVVESMLPAGVREVLRAPLHCAASRWLAAAAAGAGGPAPAQAPAPPPQALQGLGAARGRWAAPDGAA